MCITNLSITAKLLIDTTQDDGNFLTAINNGTDDMVVIERANYDYQHIHGNRSEWIVI